MSSDQSRSALLVARQSIQIERRPLPPISRRRQVQIDVTECGICDSDVRRWSHPQTLPLSLGHEVAGRVTAVGAGVTRVAVGETVAVWLPSEVKARRSQPTSRGLSDTVIVDERHCFAVTERARHPFVAEPLGRVISTIDSGVAEPRSSVVIIGSGFKALLALMLISRYDPKVVALTGTRPDSLALATQLGATCAVAPRFLVPHVSRLTRGGADVVFEFTGTRRGLELATACVRPGGRLVTAWGEIAPRFVDWGHLKQARIALIKVDAHEAENRVPRMRLGVDLLDEGFDASPLIGPAFRLERAADAFEHAQGDARRVVVTP